MSGILKFFKVQTSSPSLFSFCDPTSNPAVIATGAMDVVAVRSMPAGINRMQSFRKP
jgi:hypothetical protein